MKKFKGSGYEEGHEVTIDEALELAQGHHMEGNLLLAERTYRDILNAVPGHFPTTHFLGVMLYQMGMTDEALTYMMQAVETEPNNKHCWNNIGAVYTDMQECDKALEAYEKSLKIDPDFTESLNNKALTLWMQGDSEEAEKIVRKAVKINPEYLEAQMTLGICLSTQGQYKEANEIWKKQAEKHPNVEKIWINWGNTLRDMGHLSESEEKCRKAIEINPKEAEAHNNLGNVLRDKGRPDEAIACFKKATDLRPDYHDAHANASIAFSDQGRFEEAAVSARYAVAFKKDSVAANCALSMALRNLGDYAGARAASLRAIRSAPDKAEAYLELADANLMSDLLSDAYAAMDEAVKREPDSPRVYKKLADVLDKMGELDAAVEAIDKALEMAENMPLLWIKRAQIMQMRNDMEEAFKACDKAIELAPNWHLPFQLKAEMKITVNENAEAEEYALKALSINSEIPAPYGTLVTLQKIKDKDNKYLKKLHELEKTDMKWGLPGACSLHYSLSDAYEQLKDYDTAFEHLKKASNYKRQIVPYDPKVQSMNKEIILKRFTKDLLDSMQGKGFESDIPVFIVGMPRSGTTLTEQIISSHPDVYGAGELMEISRVREEIGHATPENAKELGERYVENVKKLDKSGKALRITDKMPGNYMNIGLILSILPNAKIIHCGRSALDTCLSCYKQNFANGQYWSYDLEELAGEYNSYLKIMEHWRNVAPGRFLDIRYEDTVGNFEEQAHKLIDYVGLEWDDACLEPHKQKRAVLTASKAQVTRPVYQSSVKKWKRYGDHLKPLIDNLEIPEEEKS